MARTQRYKNIERTIWVSLVCRIKRSIALFVRFCGTIARGASMPLTIVIVPHSQGRQISMETNVAEVILSLVLILGISASGLYFAKGTAFDKMELSRLTQKNRDTQASLDELRDANIDLLETAKKFQRSLTQSIRVSSMDGGTNAANGEDTKSGSGDLALLFKDGSAQKTSGSTVQETEEVKALTSFLENATAPVEQFGKMFDSRAVLFREIPSIWPVTNPNAHLSMAFGPNVHPITGQWYIHKGLDFSTFRSGDRVVATADGYVAMVGYDLSFGNYVIIKHKHGIYTRYAHMMYSTVKKGQYVNQKDLIGYVGNTGVTTGPHLHYEVHIGSDVVDPARYINVKLFK